ncbi:MAG: hypothetical protein ACRD6N_16385 [Pyrinomonadaceae bacterium]
MQAAFRGTHVTTQIAHARSYFSSWLAATNCSESHDGSTRVLFVFYENFEAAICTSCRGVCPSGDGIFRQASSQFTKRFDAIFHRAFFFISELYFSHHLREIYLSLNQQFLHRLFWDVEATLGASHSMHTLLKKIVSTVTMSQVIVLP